MAHGPSHLIALVVVGALAGCQCEPPIVDADAAPAIDAAQADAPAVDSAHPDQHPADNRSDDGAGADAVVRDVVSTERPLDAGHDAGSVVDASQPDAAPQLSRARQWVRDNPMFISALSVVMADPPAAWVNDYFDGFHASAAHLWQTGTPDEVAAWAAAGRADFRWVSWVDQSGNSSANGQLVGGLPADPPGRIGYQIWDEPRDWDNFLTLQPAVSAVRAHDPGALLIMNHMRNVDRTGDMIDTFIGDWGGDIVSHDAYRQDNDAYSALAQFRAAALRNNAPYWRYLKAFHYTSDGPDLEESDLRWDAFSGLVYGYTGHTWFIYQIEPTNPDLVPALFATKGDYGSAKTPLWDVVAQINVELGHLGRSVTQLTSTDVRYRASSSLNQPAGTQPWSAGAGGDPYLAAFGPAPGNLLLELLIGFFVDDAGEHYLMLQNVRHDHGDWPTDNADSGTARLSFDFSAAPGNVLRSGGQSLDKLTGNVVEVPFTSQAGDQATLDVQLAAGDVFLFKYATGAVFARH